MFSRREFLQTAIASTALTGLGGSLQRAVAQQRLTQDDLLSFDAKGKITLLHLTDIHAQLEPVYFRPPDTNIGIGDYAGIPPHLVGEEFISHFGLEKKSALAYAHTMLDYVAVSYTHLTLPTILLV